MERESVVEDEEGGGERQRTSHVTTERVQKRAERHGQGCMDVITDPLSLFSPIFSCNCHVHVLIYSVCRYYAYCEDIT
jgi:hypothetical protein